MSAVSRIGASDGNGAKTRFLSHQVAVLEGWSPTPPFLRRGRRTKLTEAGHSLAETTRLAFDSIRHEVDRLPIRGQQVVSIGAIPMAAQLCLPGVLLDLTRELPQISIHLGLALFDRPARIPPNLVVSFAHRSQLRRGDRLLFSGRATPVYSPALLALHGNDADRVLRLARRIHDEDSRPWRTWQAKADVADTSLGRPLRVSIEESSVIRAAALVGVGAAICRLELVGDDIESGRLVQLSDVQIDRAFF